MNLTPGKFYIRYYRDGNDWEVWQYIGNDKITILCSSDANYTYKYKDNILYLACNDWVEISDEELIILKAENL